MADTQDIQHIILNVSTNRGYAADQVLNETVTLGTLLEAVQAAVNEYGEDVKVVLHNGDHYGAAYGVLSAWVDLFEQEELPEGSYEY